MVRKSRNNRKTGKNFKGGNKHRTMRSRGMKGGAMNTVKNPSTALNDGELLVMKATKDQWGAGWTWSKDYYRLIQAIEPPANGGINLRISDEDNRMLTESGHGVDGITNGFAGVLNSRQNNPSNDKYFIVAFAKEDLANKFSGQKFIIIEAAWNNVDPAHVVDQLPHNRPAPAEDAQARQARIDEEQARIAQEQRQRERRQAAEAQGWDEGNNPQGQQNGDLQIDVGGKSRRGKSRRRKSRKGKSRRRR